MKNFLGFLIGGLCASCSFEAFYLLVSALWPFRSFFVGSIVCFVLAGFLIGRRLRCLPGLPAGYSLLILHQLFPDVPYLGGRLFGSCGNGVHGAAAELALVCLASGMLGSLLPALASRRSPSEQTPGLTPDPLQ